MKNILTTFFNALRARSAASAADTGAEEPIPAGDFTPGGIVAATVPISHRRDAAKAAYYDAAPALDSERIRLIFTASADGRNVHYIAAPAAEFAGTVGPTTTALAAALPGIGKDAGDGAWFANDVTGRTVVITRRNDQLKCYVGRPEHAARFAAELPVYRPDAAPSFPRWQGSNEAEVKLPRRILVAASVVQGAMAIILLTAAAALFIPASRHGAEIAGRIDAVRQQNSDAISRIQGQRNGLAALQELERLAGFKARNASRIATFRAEGDTVQWTLIAPPTLGRAQISELGDVRVAEEPGQLRIERKFNVR